MQIKKQQVHPSILNDQAIVKKQRLSALLAPLKKTALLGLIFALGYLSYKIWLNSHPNIDPQKIELTVLAFAEQGQERPSEQIKNEILDSLRQLATPLTLPAMGPVIFNNTAIARFSALLRSPNHLIIQITERQPIALIKTNQVLYLSAGGDIYETKLETELTSLPKIYGMFKSDAVLTPKMNHSIEIDPEIKAVSHDIVQIILALRALKYEIDEITFDQFRGFKLKLKDKAPVIVLGHAPFEQKIKRLEAIFEKVASLSISAVELDFKDKAFIKETL